MYFTREAHSPVLPQTIQQLSERLIRIPGYEPISSWEMRPQEVSSDLIHSIIRANEHARRSHSWKK